MTIVFCVPDPAILSVEGEREQCPLGTEDGPLLRLVGCCTSSPELSSRCASDAVTAQGFSGLFPCV